MKMFELLPRPLGSIFRKLTHFTCNSPPARRLHLGELREEDEVLLEWAFAPFRQLCFNSRVIEKLIPSTTAIQPPRKRGVKRV